MEQGKYEVRQIGNSFDVWVTDSFGFEHICSRCRESDARRIAACLNALAAYSTEAIEARGAGLGEEVAK